MARGNLRETLEKIRYGHGCPLRTRTVGSADARGIHLGGRRYLSNTMDWELGFARGLPPDMRLEPAIPMHARVYRGRKHLRHAVCSARSGEPSGTNPERLRSCSS